MNSFFKSPRVLASTLLMGVMFVVGIVSSPNVLADGGCDYPVVLDSDPKYVSWVENGEYALESNVSSQDAEYLIWNWEVVVDHASSEWDKATLNDSAKKVRFGTEGGMYKIYAADRRDSRCINTFLLYVVNFEFDVHADGVPIGTESYDAGVSSRLVTVHPEAPSPHPPVEVTWELENNEIGATINQDGLVDLPGGEGTGNVTIVALNSESGEKDELLLHVGMFVSPSALQPWELGIVNMQQYLLPEYQGVSMSWRIVNRHKTGTSIDADGKVDWADQGERLVIEVETNGGSASSSGVVGKDRLVLDIIKIRAYNDTWEVGWAEEEFYNLEEQVYFDTYYSGLVDRWRYPVGDKRDLAFEKVSSHLPPSARLADEVATIHAQPTRVKAGANGEKLTVRVRHRASEAFIDFTMKIYQIQIKEKEVFVPFEEGGTYDPLQFVSASVQPQVSVYPDNSELLDRLMLQVTPMPFSMFQRHGYGVVHQGRFQLVRIGDRPAKFKVNLFDPALRTREFFYGTAVRVSFDALEGEFLACRGFDPYYEIGERWMTIAQNGLNTAKVIVEPDSNEVWRALYFRSSEEGIVGFPKSHASELVEGNLLVESRGPLGAAGLSEELVASTLIYAGLGDGEESPIAGKFSVQVLPERIISLDFFSVSDSANPPHQSMRRATGPYPNELIAQANDVFTQQANVVLEQKRTGIISAPVRGNLSSVLFFPSLGSGTYPWINDLIRYAQASSADIPVFFVWEMEAGPPRLELQDSIQARYMYISSHDVAMLFIEDEMKGIHGVRLLHEIGHALGLPTVFIDSQDAGHSGRPWDLEFDKENGMRCMIPAADAKKANVEAGKF